LLIFANKIIIVVSLEQLTCHHDEDLRRVERDYEDSKVSKIGVIYWVLLLRHTHKLRLCQQYDKSWLL